MKQRQADSARLAADARILIDVVGELGWDATRAISAATALIGALVMHNATEPRAAMRQVITNFENSLAALGDPRS